MSPRRTPAGTGAAANRERIRTAIWLEEAAPGNPFAARAAYCHGYDFDGELLGRYGWTELVFLHLRGELPTRREAAHLDLLLAGAMNPGPRDYANRAAMTTAATGCPVGTALVAGMACKQGDLDGGQAVEDAMQALAGLAAERRPDLDAFVAGRGAGPVPGCGLLHAGRDPRARALVRLLVARDAAGLHLRLARRLERIATRTRGEWLLTHGVFAASALDLGLSPRQGHGLFMLAGGAGMLAFLSERYDRKWNEYPTWFGKGIYEYTGKHGSQSPTEGSLDATGRNGNGGTSA